MPTDHIVALRLFNNLIFNQIWFPKKGHRSQYTLIVLLLCPHLPFHVIVCPRFWFGTISEKQLVLQQQ